MFIIKTDPSFETNFGNDMVMNTAMMLAANEIARSMDDFVRECVGKVLSPESLGLFIDLKASVPGLDLEMTFYSPQKRRMRVLFKGKVIGSAYSETVLEEVEAEEGKASHRLVHKTTIEKI